MISYLLSPRIAKAILVSSMVCMAAGTHAQQAIISTYAGTGTVGYNGDGGYATNAKIASPAMVATDSAGNLYFSDYDYSVVRRVNTSGIITTVAGNGTPGYSGDGSAATAAKLNAPLGVAVDRAGNLYIADNQNNVVRKVTPTGTITTVAGNDTAGYNGDSIVATQARLNNPMDVAVDDSGNLYIADVNNYVIRKVTADGIITNFAGIPDSSGYHGNGGPATNAVLGQVFGICADHQGNVYLAESAPNHVIRKIGTDGIISLVAGNDSSAITADGSPAIDTKLPELGDIAVDDSGYIFFSEPYDNVIRKIDLAGILSTVAGNGLAGFSGDGGSPLLAELNEPLGVAIHNRELYIADVNNHRVRKVHRPTLGLATLANNKLSVYPNPCRDAITISTYENGELSIALLNMTGQLIQELTGSNVNGTFQIPIANVPNGNYLLRVTSQQGSSNILISVQR